MINNFQEALYQIILPGKIGAILIVTLEFSQLEILKNKLILMIIKIIIIEVLGNLSYLQALNKFANTMLGIDQIFENSKYFNFIDLLYIFSILMI